MQFSTSCSFHVFFFFFFLLCNYISSLPTSKFKPILLPLKIMETPPAGLLSIKPTSLQTSALQSSLPPSNRLLFKYNFSLVVSLQAGTPPQQVSMAIDTGSELSWLNCRPSTQTSCFSPTRSSTYRPVSCDSATCRNRTRDLPSPATCDASRRLCRFSAAYADASSADGTLADETLTFGQLRRQFVIGCVESSFDSSSAVAATTGLLGMNRGQLSFISQLGIPKFSYCISDRSSAGFLLLGSGGGGGGIPALNYTPFVSISLPLPYFDRVAYSVQLEGIRVGAKILPLPKSVFEPDHTGAGQTMVDSGTQFTLLLGPVYKALKNEYLERTRGFMRVYEDPNYVFQSAFDLCFRLASNQPLPEIPSVALIFRGAEVVVSGGRLLYKVPDKEGVHCFTFGNSDLVPVESYIIGHHHQQNTWVEYDLAGSRIGFAPAKCDAVGRQLSQQLRERV